MKGSSVIVMLHDFTHVGERIQRREPLPRDAEPVKQVAERARAAAGGSVRVLKAETEDQKHGATLMREGQRNSHFMFAVPKRARVRGRRGRRSGALLCDLVFIPQRFACERSNQRKRCR